VVSRDAPCLSMLVLTEDRAGDSHKTLVALVKRMLLLVDGRCGTHRVRFEPSNAGAQVAMHGNLWKSTDERNRPKRVILGKAIAEKLMEGGECPGFALFHFDGDRAWGDRASCENIPHFETFVQRYVEPLVVAILKKNGREHEATARMSRLRRLTPFYSIEAWLYQNTIEARRLCAATCGKHLEVITAWEGNRGALDEISKPKDVLCVKDRCNHELASHGFPQEQAFAVGKSYADTVMRLLECGDLCAAVGRTHAE
jgi:hypothetical protein